MSSCAIINPRSTVPPTGKWEFQLGDDRYESPVYDLVLRHTGEILAKHGLKIPAAQALADYMCPRLPKWMCTGRGPHLDLLLAKEAQKEAYSYFVRQMETVDVIMRRMEVCTTCPKHRRDFCLHCGGYDTWIYDGFGGRRTRLPPDDASGCCSCARTFEAAIASVTYSAEEPVWEGAPKTCWRYAT